MSNTSPIDKIETVRNTLAMLLVMAFIATIPMFLFVVIPDTNKEVITYMVGQLSGMALTALGFYFVNKVGQDALDAKRTENTKAALEAITATANATGGPTLEPDIVLEPGTTAVVGAEPDKP